MRDEEVNRPRWRRLIVNRFVVVLASIGIAVALWNVHVSMHNHGVVAGRVVDAAGAPVAGAEVILWVFNFTTFNERASTQTRTDGSFAFTDNPSHNIQLSAEKPGVGRSRIPVRLYFRSEDIALTQPLRLSRDSDGK